MEAGGQGLCGRSEAALEGNVCTRKARAMVGCRHCRLEGAGGKEVEGLVPRMAARTVATATRFPTSRCPQVGVARGLQQALDGKAALKALGPPARPLPSLHFRISRSRDALVPAAPKAQELPSDELAIALDFGTSMLDTLQTQLGIAKADLPAPPRLTWPRDAPGTAKDRPVTGRAKARHVSTFAADAHPPGTKRVTPETSVVLGDFVPVLSSSGTNLVRPWGMACALHGYGHGEVFPHNLGDDLRQIDPRCRALAIKALGKLGGFAHTVLAPGGLAHGLVEAPPLALA